MHNLAVSLMICGYASRGLGRWSPAPTRRPRGRRLIRGNVDLKADFVSDQPAARFEGHVPGEAPVIAAERGLEVEACPPARAGHRGVEAEELAVEGHRSRLIPDGEIDLNTVAVAEPLDPRRLGHDPGVVLRIKEIGRTEVVVAPLLAGRDAGGRCPDLTPRVGRLGFVELELAFGNVEFAPHPGDHHVLGREEDVSVGGVDLPGAHGNRLGTGS